MKTQIDASVYEAAQQTAVVVDRSGLGLLKITGESRLDLIHRMSTQDVNGLRSGEGKATILTTDIGRIIDRLILYASSNMVYALTGEGNGDAIARYLMRYVFFNDDFQIQDIGDDTAIFGVYGPQAPLILGEQLGFPEVDIPLHHWREAEIAGITAYLHRTDPIHGFGYFIMCEIGEVDNLSQFLRETRLVAASEEAYDYLRIEEGLPRLGRELSEVYIPLEADLWEDVSFTKGCYIGQEIIARMESRGQLAKRLVRLSAKAAIDQGSDISSGGKKVGSITSVAQGPQGVLALGYVKAALIDNGADLYVGETAVQLR
jgi:aminomethyltransferase